MQYQDFEITILPQRDDHFPVRVSSPAGGDGDHFRLPYSEEELSKLIPDLSRSVARGTTRSSTLEEPPPEDLVSAEDVGRQLFEALFSSKVRFLFERSMGRLEDKADVGLRIKLRIDPDESQDLALISALPWEYMYDHDTWDYLSLSMRTPVVRYLDVPHPPAPKPRELPQRNRYVMASPEDQLELNLGKERDLINQALKQHYETGRVEFDILEHATVKGLLRKLDDKKYHVVHYMGHGGFDAVSGEGALCLEKEDGLTDYLPAGKLVTMLRDRRSVRLVFLNACQTAAVAEKEEGRYDAFMGVAPALVMGGVTAVIAMQFPISDEAAMAFSDELYAQLAKSTPVDEAVSKARQAVQVRTVGQEWGTPVLFMRTSDGKIFDITVEMPVHVEPEEPEIPGEEEEQPPLDEPEEEVTPPKPDVVRLGPLVLPRKVAIGLAVVSAVLIIIAVLVVVLWKDDSLGGDDSESMIVAAVMSTPTVTGTATPTRTAPSTLTSTPSRTPTGTLTPTATRTPTATSTWTTTPRPTLEVEQPWLTVYSGLSQAWRDELGAGIGRGENLVCERQPFERGFMFWCNPTVPRRRYPAEGWQPANIVFVIVDKHPQQKHLFWFEEDTWTTEDGEVDCGRDLESLLADAPELTDRFRKIWCQQGEIREELGLPSAARSRVPNLTRRNDRGPGIHEFTGGWMLWDTHTGKLYVLIEGLGWDCSEVGPATVTPSPTLTSTPSSTPSPSPTATTTRTGTPSPTPFMIPTLTRTPYVTVSPTRTPYVTVYPTPSPDLTTSPTPTP